jgi:membrane associated rhomboid family serine protease
MVLGPFPTIEMRRPPSLQDWLGFPVTSLIGLLGIVATLAYGQGTDVSFLFEDVRIEQGELWRLVTSTFPHIGLLHLAFNLYWLWMFGTTIEEVLGSRAMIGLFLLFAAGSSAGEFAFFDGGIGLSGAGYGFFGMLLVLRWKDPRFEAALDSRTISLFVIWFFLCIGVTVKGIYPIANMAHGVGAVLGALTGLALVSSGYRRLIAISATSVVFLCLILAATAFRPVVCFSSRLGEDLAYLGAKELLANRNDPALKHLRQAIDKGASTADTWFNLSIAYQRQGLLPQAADAMQHALDLKPNDPRFREALAKWRACQASVAQHADQHEKAIALFQETLKLTPQDKEAATWKYGIGVSYDRLGNQKAEALAEAARLNLLNPARSTPSGGGR